MGVVWIVGQVGPLGTDRDQVEDFLILSLMHTLRGLIATLGKNNDQVQNVYDHSVDAYGTIYIMDIHLLGYYHSIDL